MQRRTVSIRLNREYGINPFEQLQLLVPEPRQAFEDVAANIIRAVIPGTRRVRVYQGDGGVDVFRGSYGTTGGVEVYQIKYFPGIFDNSRKDQIRNSYRAALNSPDYKLKKWILCVPLRLTKDDLRWFDQWRDEQEVSIELLDGDDLTDWLQKSECEEARKQMGRWGVAGMQAGGARFEGDVVLGRASNCDSVLIVRLKNVGNLTAKNLRVELSHDETNCGALMHDDSFWQIERPGQINPWVLRCLDSVHNGATLVILGIPFSQTTPSPFAINLKIQAEDTLATNLWTRLVLADLQPGRAIPLTLGESPVPADFSQTKRNRPAGQAATEVLELILGNSNTSSRGIVEILEGSPMSPLDAAFMPSIASGGSVSTMRKRLFREAIDELLTLGWLCPPEIDFNTATYELNPE